MDVVLVMFTEKGERRDFPIHDGKAVIGRNTDCNIQIPLGEVSRKHCELALKKDKVVVRDLGSSNGTYVNNKRIQQTELGAGETLTVGPVVFTVAINGAPEDIKPVRSVIGGKKKKKAEAPKKAPANDESGSVDLAGSADLGTVDEDSGGSSVPAELEELSKQRKGKP